MSEVQDVYAGLRRLGEVRRQSSGDWAATTDDERTLGIFATIDKGKHALLQDFADRRGG